MSRTTNCIGHAIEAHFGPRIGWRVVSKTFPTREIGHGVLALVKLPQGIKYELRVYEVLAVK